MRRIEEGEVFRAFERGQFEGREALYGPFTAGKSTLAYSIDAEDQRGVDRVFRFVYWKLVLVEGE